jgi:hypothetical protein
MKSDKMGVLKVLFIAGFVLMQSIWIGSLLSPIVKMSIYPELHKKLRITLFLINFAQINHADKYFNHTKY